MKYIVLIYFSFFTCNLWAQSAQPSIAPIIKDKLLQEGEKAAIHFYYTLKRNALEEYNFEQSELDQLGYELLQENKVPEALAIFNLNINAYPTSAEAYAAYAEALVAKGDTVLAIEYFDKSNYVRPNRRAVTQLFSVLKEEKFKRKALEEVYSYTPFEMYDYALLSTPESQGISSEVLADAMDEAAKIPQLIGVLVARNNHLIAENYYQHGPLYRTDLREATTSVTSALLGIAIQKKFIKSIDTPVRNYFEDYQSGQAGSLTLRKLISMTSGLKPTESQQKKWLKSRYKNEEALFMDVQSNGRFHFSAEAAHLVASAIHEASGWPLFGFSKRYFFQGAVLYPKYWTHDETGYYYGAEGLCLNVREMATIGNLFLNKGKHHEKQLIPSAWLSQAMSKQTDLSEPDHYKAYLQNYGYGYGFWIHQFAGHKVVVASGAGGQNMVMVPSMKLLIVTTADQRDLTGKESIKNWIFNLIQKIDINLQK